jgi:hypothetical protein
MKLNASAKLYTIIGILSILMFGNTSRAGNMLHITVLNPTSYACYATPDQDIYFSYGEPVGGGYVGFSLGAAAPYATSTVLDLDIGSIDFCAIMDLFVTAYSSDEEAPIYWGQATEGIFYSGTDGYATVVLAPYPN